MTPHNENKTARFLLAILNQFNHKHIDWEKVASDPLLLEPCPNAHAARMRFSRFKSAVTGHQPQKRNKTAADKNRVTKSKKAQPAKRDSLVKSDSGVSLASLAPACQNSPRIKQEQNHTAYGLAQFSPESNTSPYLDTMHDDFNATRFLTPCSDDMTHNFGVNPAALEDIRVRNGFGPSTESNQELFRPTNDFAGHAQSPVFPTFDAEYDLSNFRTAGDAYSPDALGLNGTPLAEYGNEWTIGRVRDPKF